MKIFNTLSGKKEEFSPQGNEVKMYVCGVTPYSDAHLGHAMSYIIFDVIRRYLQFSKYKVRYVQNFTDIDDKIINRANQRGISTRELADEFIDSFQEDMKALNIMPPDITPRATAEIPKMIEVIQGLIDRGFAYPARGSVYFRVRKAPDYGKLSHRSLDSMTAGAMETGEEKEDPLDFVLWKASKPGEPQWESPWGPGRPGWHIECSAMSLKYLGDTIDIHGGGQDLIFPHHENEIAQSESFTGLKPFAKYWLHNGLVQLGGEKMSKSLGNLITIKEALQKYNADALRVFVLSSHYRSPLTYSEEVLEAANGGVERLLRVVSRDDTTGGKGETLDAEPYRKQFIEAMDDDFNTPQALAALFDLVRKINEAGDSGIRIDQAQSTLLSLALEVLGLKLPKIQIISGAGGIISGESVGTHTIIQSPIDDRVKRLIEERNRLRQAKQWQQADSIRAELEKQGIILEDTTKGTIAILKRK
ncbi:MAG: cysteine--tRNA ligase [Chloroflexi bacterium RBG_16_50_9]|nr:MAG: cysteine--tRNA ligase [Chloroflexi bacterium RBG_16_50_9]